MRYFRRITILFAYENGCTFGAHISLIFPRHTTSICTTRNSQPISSFPCLSVHTYLLKILHPEPSKSNIEPKSNLRTPTTNHLNLNHDHQTQPKNIKPHQNGRPSPTPLQIQRHHDLRRLLRRRRARAQENGGCVISHLPWSQSVFYPTYTVLSVSVFLVPASAYTFPSLRSRLNPAPFSTRIWAVSCVDAFYPDSNSPSRTPSHRLVSLPRSFVLFPLLPSPSSSSSHPTPPPSQPS